MLRVGMRKKHRQRSNRCQDAIASLACVVCMCAEVDLCSDCIAGVCMLVHDLGCMVCMV